MLSKASFEACPSCGCHVARGSVSCPHCDRVFERTRGRLQPALVAVMMGLGAVAASTTACSGGSGDDGTGGEGAGVDDGDGDGDGGYPSAVSTYGVGPSSTTTQSSSSGVVCPGVNDGTPCGGCLAISCCSEGVACLESQPCLDVTECLDACDPNDLACATTCQDTYPDGFTLYQSFWQCGDASCDVCFE